MMIIQPKLIGRAVLIISLLMVFDVGLAEKIYIQSNIVQSYEIYTADELIIKNHRISIIVKGIGSEHHSDDTVIDNLGLLIVNDGHEEMAFIEIIDGKPVPLLVNKINLIFTSCSATHQVCTVKISSDDHQ